MSEIIRASLDGLREFADVNTVFGSPIRAEGGVTVIPVSKISVGFLGGGVDLPAKKLLPPQSFGGGTGLGISSSPVAFLVIKPDGEVTLMPLTEAPSPFGAERLLELIEYAPEIIEKIKNAVKYG